MGTRADFYVGKGKDTEWIGSIAWDGFLEGIDEAVLTAHSETDFRTAVREFFSARNDVTLPEQGWPWPWDNSGTTDCSYWFFDDRCWDDDGGFYRLCDGPPPAEIEYPDMSARKNFTLDPDRSGVIVVTASTA